MNPMIRIAAWTLPFFFIMLAYETSYAGSGLIEKQMYAADSGLIIESLQALPGDVLYRQNTKFDLELKGNSVIASKQDVTEKSRYDFAKDRSSILIDSKTVAGDAIFKKSGAEIIIINKEPEKKTEQQIISKKLACQATVLDLNLSDLNIVIDPGHGGIDSGFTVNDANGESMQESNLVFGIANLFKMSHGSQAKISVTREAASNFLDIDERLAKAKDADIMISLHVGDKTNKGRISVYVPSDQRAKESAAAACAISNGLFGNYQISYPAEISVAESAADDLGILAAGKIAAIYIEIGSIDDAFNSQSLSDAIFNGLKKYAEKSAENQQS